MSQFQREDRYIVIKRSDLKKVPVSYRSHLVDPMFSLLGHLPRRECVVVESDWPEYHLVWAMLEHRMAGKPVPDFNLWRRADELQQRLAEAESALPDIGDFAHDQSTGPAVPDALWEVRRMAYDAYIGPGCADGEPTK